MRPIDEIEDDFYRDVEIVRGAGGFAPTTADLQWLGEQRAYAAMGSTVPQMDEAELEELRRMDAEEQAVWEARSTLRKLADLLAWHRS